MGAALCTMAVLTPARAQAPAKLPVHTAHHQNVWFSYVGDHALGDSARAAILADVQVRRAERGQTWQQLMGRAGLAYAFGSTRVAAGYARAESWPIGDAAGGLPTAEHRLWQQVAITHSYGSVSVTQRYRFEQRWLKDPGPSSPGGREWAYQRRMRLQFRGTMPLSREGTSFVFGTSELFSNVGRGIRYAKVDQSRLSLGAGRRISRHERLEIGYLYQRVERFTQRERDHNHTVQMTFASSRPLAW